MKQFNKWTLCFLAVCLAFLGTMTTSQAMDGTAGSEVTITFNYSNITGLDGSISVNDPNQIIENYKITGHTFGSKVTSTNTETGIILNSIDGSSFNGGVKVTVTLKSTAKTGQSATISFTGHTSNANLELVKNGANQTLEIKVVDEKKATSSNSSSNANSSSQTSDNSSSEIDYSKLQNALNQANGLIQSDEKAKLWQSLFETILNGNALLESDDQALIDQGTEDILDAIEKIESFDGSEVQETSADCTKTIHKIWPILFIISLAINAGFIYTQVIQKRKNFVDNIPVVDYDINDDDGDEDDE